MNAESVCKCSASSTYNSKKVNFFDNIEENVARPRNKIKFPVILTKYDTMVNSNPATPMPQTKPTLKLNSPIIERFQPYECFRAPGPRDDPKKDI
ncbi:unnamed protein product [Adineta steineri]|uniref:Uncharacterized protein n=1 Tax=Adineta steineri TaxID=433720 RepID=A0A814DMJ6_9BILA|nr:unnamed protein product [Adineta steineri]CAF0956545.1 unnamed protein product [Adineta steineri]CAF0961572.1 unnamed protein product [Adineta steineri]